MSEHRIALHAQIAAPVATVFAAFADHETFGKLWPGRTRRIREGTDHPNGKGSVRHVRSGLVSLEETTTVYQPPELLEYRITRGTPLRDHYGRLQFRSTATGTDVDYEIYFRCPIPWLGTVIARQLEQSFHSQIGPWSQALTQPQK